MLLFAESCSRKPILQTVDVSEYFFDVVCTKIPLQEGRAHTIQHQADIVCNLVSTAVAILNVSISKLF